MSIPVVTVGRAGDDLVGGLERLHGPVTVVRRCDGLPELLAACQSGLARAAIVAEGSEGLTATLVDRLSAVGVAVLAITDSQSEAARLLGLGVASAPAGVGPEDLSGRIAEAVAMLTRSDARHPGASWTADAGPALRRLPERPAASREPSSSGRVLAVWGPAGAPGRTIVATNIAGELAGEGKKVLLVDADTYGASTAAVLGLLDESAGLAQACRLADQGVLDAEALRRAASTVAARPGTFQVLTGLTRADRWTEVRASALTIVLERARQQYEVVVVDTGFCLESDEELSFDSMAPRRNAATLRTLELADTVYAVGAGDAVGVPRLVRGLTELEAAVPQASPVVVMNKVRASAVGRGPERQLREAWERYGPAVDLGILLPYDRAAADAALLAGELLMEAAPESALRRAIRGIVCAVEQRKRKSSVFSSTPRRRPNG